MALAVGTRLGSRKIIAPLGAGGMGEVYRATDSPDGQLLAVDVQERAEALEVGLPTALFESVILRSSPWTRAALTLLTLVGVIVGPGPTAAAQAPRSSESTVVLVSLDGFRADYLQRRETPHLDALAARGACADALIPVFPAKTFPGHYSIVTGLYPEHHGILSNAMYDPEFDAEFRFSNRDGHLGTSTPQWHSERAPARGRHQIL